jgi:hypothetical protein
VPGAADDAVVHNAADNGRYAGKNAFIQGPGQGGQFARQGVGLRVPGVHDGLKVAHARMGYLGAEAINEDEDDGV